MKKNINLKELFQSSNKDYEMEMKSKIESITRRDELIFVDIINNNNYYKGLTILKSEIFPEPSNDSRIVIKKYIINLMNILNQGCI